MLSAQAKRIHSFLYPSSIAVIGASRDPKKIGNICIRSIQDSGFKGKIYPVNPNAANINSLQCYSNISELPDKPELVLVVVPADKVIGEFEKIIDAEIKNVVVFSAGFKETGSAGADLEDKLKQLAKYHDVNLLGPNCLGFLNLEAQLNATFAQDVKKHGKLRFLSQSGAVAASMFDYANFAGLGFDQFVTLGNKAGLIENDFLEYWLSLPDSSPVGLYLESISNGKEFVEQISRLSKKAPLFILKPGTSVFAQKAMRSHTGALAGESRVFEAAMKQSNALICHDVEDLIDYAKTFSWSSIPTGPNVAVISNAGGPAVIASDLIASVGLKLYPFDVSTQELLRAHLPRSASILNPVDLLGDALPDRYAAALEAVLSENAVDMCLVILTPQVMTQAKETAEVIVEVSKKYNKPIFCTFIGGTNTAQGEKILNDHMIPNFRYPSRAVKMMADLWFWEDKRQNLMKQSVSTLAGFGSASTSVKNQESCSAESSRLFEMLVSEGIDIPAHKYTSDVNEAIDFCKANSYPVVLKIDSSKNSHKTEVQGVITNIADKTMLSFSYEKLIQKSETGKLLIQKQIEQGVELIVGAKYDADFGHVLMFGAGGTLVELLEDIDLKLFPINFEDAQDLVSRSKVFKLLDGYRGKKSFDLNKLYEVIVKFAHIVQRYDFREIEINPLIINDSGVFAVDVRATCK